MLRSQLKDKVDLLLGFQVAIKNLYFKYLNGATIKCISFFSGAFHLCSSLQRIVCAKEIVFVSLTARFLALTGNFELRTCFLRSTELYHGICDQQHEH